ncbi:hypothetical protein BVRB_2g030510 isoform B [Beta vulgaris subsp. vulgaris]|nr:hypothetical protein BVRB_2g030510 isoform B [Beta vulgaris subsp. vulgaris]
MLKSSVSPHSMGHCVSICIVRIHFLDDFPSDTISSGLGVAAGMMGVAKGLGLLDYIGSHSCRTPSMALELFLNRKPL